MRLSKPSRRSSLERLVGGSASWRQVGVHAVAALGSCSLAYLAGLQTVDMAESYLEYSTGFLLSGGCAGVACYQAKEFCVQTRRCLSAAYKS